MCVLCNGNSLSACPHALGSNRHLGGAATARSVHCLETRVVERVESRRPGFFRDVTEDCHVPKPGAHDADKCARVRCPYLDDCKALAKVASQEEAIAAS